jgi:hypothetical protein
LCGVIIITSLTKLVGQGYLGWENDLEDVDQREIQGRYNAAKYTVPEK